MKASMSISGGEGLTTFFNAKQKIGSEAIAVVKRNGTEMQYQAMKNAPVLTGFLKRNITLNFINSMTDFAAQVDSKASYAPYQEYGTRFMAGTPHIRPAYASQKKQFVDEISRLADK